MFKYACRQRGLDYSVVNAVDVPSGQMDRAFRKGEGSVSNRITCYRPRSPHLTGPFGRVKGRAAATIAAATAHRTASRQRPLARIDPQAPAHRERHHSQGRIDRWTRSQLLAHGNDRTLDKYEHLLPNELHTARQIQDAGLGRYISGAEG